MSSLPPQATLTLVWLCFAFPLCASGNYHVDCSSGSDAASGLSSQEAWKSLAKVSSTTFAPGDTILLRRGTRCPGTLWPKGSGEEGRPIRIGAYGAGPLPLIEAGATEAAVKLFDQHHWEIENLESAGGSPYGVLISGASGRLRHFRLRNLVVRDVTGMVKSKGSGLVAVLAPPALAIEDVVIDGVTAYNTTQWAGIIVRGGSRENRARDVTVRNSIVHDVYGDGIVLFQVENGLIEKSAAWLTGLQPVQTIGTPNGIWTWRCRNCTVRLTEGFFIDSPGVDGGVYDIDWGNDDNVIEYNYAHDAQGYCASVFAASKEVTTNSVVRHNVCVNNGRSPKLARRQGDIYISTWEGGALDGVLIHDNTVIWNPPIDAPAVQMDRADFTGSRPNLFANNVIYSTVPSMIHSSRSLKFERNVYWYGGARLPKWSYGDREYVGFEQYRAAVGPDAAESFARPRLDALFGPLPPPRPAPDLTLRGADGPPLSLARRNGKWLLLLLADPRQGESRSQLVFLQSALAQYGDRNLEAALAVEASPDGLANLRYDWNLGAVRPLFAGALRSSVGAAGQSVTLLVSASGEIVRQWTGFAAPAELGLELKRRLEPPAGAPGLH